MQLLHVEDLANHDDQLTESKKARMSATAALVAFAREQQFEVPQEWVFEDDGYSGASLIRPGLERVRDLAGLPVRAASVSCGFSSRKSSSAAG